MSGENGYPEGRLNKVACQNCVAATYQHIFIFWAPIGTAIPNDIHTPQATKPGARQRRLSTNFSLHRHIPYKYQCNSGDTDQS